MNYPNSTVIDVNVLMVLMSVINYKQALHEFIESIVSNDVLINTGF